jgi:hypothetical protein
LVIKIELGPQIRKVPQMTKTMAEEVWTLVQSWYFSRGRRVPPDEEKICKDDIAKEKKEQLLFETFMTRSLLKDELEAETDYSEKARIIQGITACDAILKEAPQVTVVKAAHGSPEFWKAYWAKKKANGWVPKAKAKVN